MAAWLFVCRWSWAIMKPVLSYETNKEEPKEHDFISGAIELWTPEFSHSKFLKSNKVWFSKYPKPLQLSFFSCFAMSHSFNGFFLWKCMYQKTLLNVTFFPLHLQEAWRAAIVCGSWTRDKCYCTFFCGTNQLLPKKSERTLNKQHLAGLGVVNCSMNHI